MIKLVKLTKDKYEQFKEMMDEWTYDIKVNHTNRSPSTIFRNDYHDIDSYLEKLECKEEIDGRVPDSVLFLYDDEADKFLGAANIRHKLNEILAFEGGHIGDGIRPTERKKGYGTLLIKLALEECKKLGIDKVLITADWDNYGSQKTITNNGGVFENEIIDSDGIKEYRYWVDLTK